MYRKPLLLCTLIVAGWLVSASVPVSAQEKEEPKEKRGGTIIGVLTAKGPNFIEVKAAGEEKGRKYVPHWRGGLPAQGGGLDKQMLETFKKLKVGSRVKIEWEFEERPRVVRVEVLKAAEGDREGKREKKGEEGEEARQKGKVIGTLTAKGDNFIEVKAPGEEKARRYVLHFGGSRELLKAMREIPTGTRVEVDWMFLERLRVLGLRQVGKDDTEK